jgi:septum site-determining protein MinD
MENLKNNFKHNFENKELEKRGKVIVISSGKGGVGKTTTCVNLAYSLSKLGKEVILVDANLTTPNVALHLGLTKFPVTLNDALSGDATLEDCIYIHPMGFKLVPGSLSVKSFSYIDSGKIRKVFNKLKKMADFVIVDSAAGLGNEALSIIRNADEILLVTHPEIPSVTDAFKVITLAKEIEIPVRSIILNRVKHSNSDLGLNAIENLLETPITIVLGEEKRMREALYSKKPISHLHPKIHTSKQFSFLANRVNQGYYQRKIEDLEMENSKLKRTLRNILE